MKYPKNTRCMTLLMNVPNENNTLDAILDGNTEGTTQINGVDVAYKDIQVIDLQFHHPAVFIIFTTGKVEDKKETVKDNSKELAELKLELKKTVDLLAKANVKLAKVKSVNEIRDN